MTFRVMGEWLVEESEGCNCGTAGIDTYGHEPNCGLEPLGKVEDMIARSMTVEKIRVLHSATHRTVAYDAGEPTYTTRCVACGGAVPCPTMQLIEEGS